ncbi:HD domain-containing protein [Pedobacter sp. WC2501]|uniref:HD domain-containing protein n=1 Tax=Pedobacter sp. WC2501 TaxID=3461400 RepID=UPI004046679C
MLKDTFINLLTNYTDSDRIIPEFWAEIEENYTHKKRHYHTLSHLENLLTQLTEVKVSIESWESILFTMFYHDIIYDALKSDNEEKSAELAQKRMSHISVPNHIIDNCKTQIIATKKHLAYPEPDTNYFTDADLSILGQSLENYTTYSQNVRKEYSIYPDLIYNPGRKKVLEHFIKMERIFKTDYFYKKFESQAKSNLQFELEQLG